MPTLDLQVAASNCDGYESPESTGAMNITSALVCVQAHLGASARAWGAFRWSSGSFPVRGDIIIACYVTVLVYTSSGIGDDPRLYWHFQLATSPAVFTTAAFNITSRSRTAGSVAWNVENIGAGWKTTPSLVTPMQELIDSYSPTDIVLIGRPSTEYSAFNRNLYARSWDYGSTSAAILHLEWTPGLVAPTVATNACSGSTETTLTGNGEITATGGENCHTRGFCYKKGTSGDPTTADDKVFDNGVGSYGIGAFSKLISGLQPSTPYRVRAYATNTAGTSYGATVQCATTAAVVTGYVEITAYVETLIRAGRQAIGYITAGGIVTLIKKLTLTVRGYITVGGDVLTKSKGGRSPRGYVGPIVGYASWWRPRYFPITVTFPDRNVQVRILDKTITVSFYERTIKVR